MMKGKDFYKLLGAMYDLREKTFDTEENIEAIIRNTNSLTQEKLDALTEKLEDFNDLLTDNIIDLLKKMQEFEEV